MASLNSFFPQIDQYDPKPMMEQNRQNALLDLQQKTFGMQQNKFAQEQADAANKRKQEAAMKIGQAALTIQTEPEFNALRDFAVQNGFPEAAQYTFQQLPQIRAMFQQSGAFTGDSFQAQQANALVAQAMRNGMSQQDAMANVADMMLTRTVPYDGGVATVSPAARGYVGGNSISSAPASQTDSSIQPPPSSPDMTRMTGQQTLGAGMGDKPDVGGMASQIGTGVNMIVQPPDRAQRAASETLAKETAQQAAAMPKAEQSLNAFNAKVDNTLAKIDEALSGVGGWTSGVGSMLSGIPGTPARSLSGDLDTIKANLGFQELSEMRANSPTGGALGQVTERELAFLQSTLASLDQGLPPEKLRENLAQIKQRLLESKGRISDGFQRDAQRLGYAPAQQQAAPAAPAATGNVVRWEDLP